MFLSRLVPGPKRNKDLEKLSRDMVLMRQYAVAFSAFVLFCFLFVLIGTCQNIRNHKRNRLK
jgi:hypothetical protein